MVTREQWAFYGRNGELQQLETILRRQRWFFARITGRRRIGKTTLIQRALEHTRTDRVFYVQIPDSAPAGVLSAFSDAMETFDISPSTIARPTTLLEMAQTVGALARAGYVVALDEFQYFARQKLHEFTSHLQAVVDGLSHEAEHVTGGLFVLGSLHTELVALLEDRDAPLYNRTTDTIELDHLDIASVVEVIGAHAEPTPERLLFLWNLFEGVPKFYRDCFEQGVLSADRHQLLDRMFFESSSPLRSEADNWFLGELRGRYDVVLKYVARQPGCTNSDLAAHVRETSPDSAEQVGGYLKILSDKYRMVEKRLPILSKPKARKGRFYVRDNFLRSWLHALSHQVQAINFRPRRRLIKTADERLAEAEGFGLERLVAALYEERSRKDVGDFSLTHRIDGFWDRAGTEIDLIALDEEARRIRFGTCKRSVDKLLKDTENHEKHVQRFLETNKAFKSWTIERVAIAPRIEAEARAQLEEEGLIPQDLLDLTGAL